LSTISEKGTIHSNLVAASLHFQEIKTATSVLRLLDKACSGDLPLLHSVHPVTYSVVTGGSFPVGKGAEHSL
jgi:hypothetical protein